MNLVAPRTGMFNEQRSVCDRNSSSVRYGVKDVLRTKVTTISWTNEDPTWVMDYCRRLKRICSQSNPLFNHT